MTYAARLRVACVGAGYFRQFHYGSWSRMDRVDLVGACDRDLGRARATGLCAYDDLSAMLAEQAPDLLDVILPPEAQAQAIGLSGGHPTGAGHLCVGRTRAKDRVGQRVKE